MLFSSGGLARLPISGGDETGAQSVELSGLMDT